MPTSTSHLSIAVGDYDHVRDLVTGTVRPDGLSLHVETRQSAEIFRRFPRDASWDAAEMSLAQYAVRRSRGETDLVGLPVFPARSCRHSAFYVQSGSAVRRPEDLRGARIGMMDWAQTGLVAARGLLADEFDIELGDIHWVLAGVDQPSGEAARPLVPNSVGAHFDLRVDTDHSLWELLDSGELDCVISILPPADADRLETIRPLFEDLRSAEQSYVRATGVLPIMHVIAIRAERLDGDDTLALRLFDAFDRARELSVRRVLDRISSRLPFPWVSDASAEIVAAFPDHAPLRYGVSANLRSLEAFVRWTNSQRVTATAVSVADLFPMPLYVT